MLKKRLSFILLLCFCFGNLSLDSCLHWNEESKNSREFIFGNLVFAQFDDSGSKQTNKSETKDTKDTFHAEKYSDMYKKAVEDIYDKFEKAYRRNQEIINRSSGLINQTGYQRLLNKQVESEALFTKAFATAKITKNGDELVFPEFKFDEVKNAVEQLQDWITEKNKTYVEKKRELDEKISACVTPYEHLENTNEYVLKALNEIETL